MNTQDMNGMAMQHATEMIETWTLEELKLYAFDRLVDELIGPNNDD